jgi:ribosomal protein L7/L12
MDPTMIVAGLVIGAAIGFVILKFMFGAKPQGGVVVDQPPRERLAPASMDEVAELNRQGRKIEAIKIYRELTGVGLAEAKSAVEAMEAGHSVVPPAQPAINLDQDGALREIRTLMQTGEKIQAIKKYREVFGVGLAEAKDAVERL